MKDIFAGLVVFIWLSLAVAIPIGWVMNIITLVNVGTIVFTGEIVLRIVGIFIFPLGAIMGWFF